MRAVYPGRGRPQTHLRLRSSSPTGAAGQCTRTVPPLPGVFSVCRSREKGQLLPVPTQREGASLLQNRGPCWTADFEANRPDLPWQSGVPLLPVQSQAAHFRQRWGHIPWVCGNPARGALEWAAAVSAKVQAGTSARLGGAAKSRACKNLLWVNMPWQ